MNLLQIAQAIKDADSVDNAARGHAILLYGPPKVGKTALAATAAESDNIDRVFYFDNENSWETLMWMLASGKLSQKAAAKIQIININDSVKEPYAIETMLRVTNSLKAPVYVRFSDGKLLPQKPQPMNDDTLEFQLSKLTKRDLVIVDTLSQLGDSSMAAIMLNRSTIKPEWDDYAAQGKQLGDILSIMQQARHCNFICITHQVLLPDEDDIEKFFPMCGSRAFCYKVGKYFGTVAHLGIKVGKHVAGSSSTYSKQAITGSRRGLKLEKAATLSLAPIFDSIDIDLDNEGAKEPAPSTLKKRTLLNKN